MHIHIRIYMYIHVYTCICIHVHVYAQRVHTRASAQEQSTMGTRVHKRTYMHIQARTSTHTSASTHIQAHTCTHKHIQHGCVRETRTRWGLRRERRDKSRTQKCGIFVENEKRAGGRRWWRNNKTAINTLCCRARGTKFCKLVSSTLISSQ